MQLFLINKDDTKLISSRKMAEESHKNSTLLKMPVFNSNPIQVGFPPFCLLVLFISNREVIVNNLVAAMEVRQINTTNWPAHNLLILK